MSHFRCQFLLLTKQWPNVSVTVTQYNRTTLQGTKTKPWNTADFFFQNLPPPLPSPALGEDVSLACYFYCGAAKWNRWLQQSLYGGKNQYSNIRARLIRASLLLRGHGGATAFKWGIQLWNIVWDEPRRISDQGRQRDRDGKVSNESTKIELIEGYGHSAASIRNEKHHRPAQNTAPTILCLHCRPVKDWHSWTNSRIELEKFLLICNCHMPLLISTKPGGSWRNLTSCL